MATTTRWGLPYPVDTDAADVPVWMRNLALALDDHAKDDQGTLANRPVSTAGSPGKRGRYYMVKGDPTPANNGILWRDNGTGWDPVGGSGAASLRGAGTALPSSPANGDTYDWDVYNALVGAGYFTQIDDTLSGSAKYWPIIYVAGNTYPWKIRAHNGPRLRAIENAQVWRPGAGWGDPLNGGGTVFGPLLYVPRTGHYRVRCGCHIVLQGGGGLAVMYAAMNIANITTGGTLLIKAGNPRVQAFDGGLGWDWIFSFSAEGDPVLLSAGDQVRAQYYQNSGFTSGTFFQDKWLELIPLEFV